MKFSGVLSLMVMTAGTLLGQTAPPAGGHTQDSSVVDELKALREAVTQQQQQIKQQQEQVLEQQKQIDALQKTLEAKTVAHVEDAALRTTNNTNEAAAVASDEPPQDKPKESPLSFRIGGAEFTPGGFADFENIFRTTNTGNVSGTTFGAIPYSNTVQGHLTEYRATGQYSRWYLKVTTKFGANDVTGYLEGDFNGSDPANVFVTSNSHTDRLRLYWADIRRGRWEFLGGQSWGWATPNRNGLSPMPSDLAITINADANIQVGINYTRAAAFRAVYHFSDNFQWGVAVENPQQFIGASEVVFPAAFAAQLGSQFDNGTVPGTPNMAPDLWTKMAWDGNPGKRKMHFEVGGVMTTARATFLPTVAGSQFQHTTNVGGGLVAATTLSMTPNFRFVANGLAGKGVGRYMIGMGPNVVLVPVNFGGVCTSAGNCGLEVSGVRSGAGMAGAEWQATPKSLFGFYYGAAYFQRNTFPDITSPAVLKPAIGFGGFTAVNNLSSNRAIQEATIDWTQTFWKNPQYGAVLLVTQTSYLTRAPWFVALGAPKNAHLMMSYVSLRYVLP